MSEETTERAKDDLVARLRHVGERHTQVSKDWEEYETVSRPVYPPAIQIEAADEIERLRAALAAARPSEATMFNGLTEAETNATRSVSGLAAPRPEVPQEAVAKWPTEQITEYIEDYEFCGDEGYYSPSERERDLIADAIHGLLAENEILAAICACRATPPEPQHAASQPEMPPAIEGRLSVWLTNGAELHPNTVNLVVRFARALASKLAAAEKKYGFTDGWRDTDWMDDCRKKLKAHMAKGDPRDVAAYCAFLWHHGESTVAPPQALRDEAGKGDGGAKS